MSGGCCSTGKCLGSSAQSNAPETKQQATTPPDQTDDSSIITIEVRMSENNLFLYKTPEVLLTVTWQEMDCCGFGNKDSDAKGEPHGKLDTQPTSCSPSDTKRIILTIENLKCGCCGDGGISRALDQITGVYNHNVNVVLARAEFDLDTRRISVSKVTKRLAAVTGYTFKQYFQPHGQVLEILIDDPVEIQRVSVRFSSTHP